MRAKAGDKLLAGSGLVAVIVDVIGADGHPPYIVKWLADGHIAMVSPGEFARVIPAAPEASEPPAEPPAGMPAQAPAESPAPSA